MNYRDQVLKIIGDEANIKYHAYIPLDRHLSKKNGRTIGRVGNRLIPTKSYELVSAEKHITVNLCKYRREGSTTITRPVWAIFLFHFARSKYFTKKREVNKKLPDLSNLYELPQDCLEAAGVIENDHLIWSHDLSRRIPADETAIEIWLLDMDDYFLEFIDDQAP